MHVHSDDYRDTCCKIIIIIIATILAIAGLLDCQIAQNFRTNYSRIILLEKILEKNNRRIILKKPLFFWLDECYVYGQTFLVRHSTILTTIYLLLRPKLVSTYFQCTFRILIIVFPNDFFQLMLQNYFLK